MKIKLCDQSYGIQKPDLKAPIVLADIELSKNKHGQILLSFATHNHKYLDVDYNLLSSHVEGEYCEHGMAHGFEISTQEEYRPEGMHLDYPEDSVTLYLIPENKEELKQLRGQACVIPTKWSYSICIVPFEDFCP